MNSIFICFICVGTYCKKDLSVPLRRGCVVSAVTLAKRMLHTLALASESAEQVNFGAFLKTQNDVCGLPVGNLRMLAFIVAVAPALARPMPQVPGMRAAAPVPVYYDHDHEVCAHKAHSTRTPRATHRKAHGSRSTRFRAIELPGPQVDASDGAQCVVGPTGNQTAAAAV